MGYNFVRVPRLPESPNPQPENYLGGHGWTTNPGPKECNIRGGNTWKMIGNVKENQKLKCGWYTNVSAFVLLRNNFKIVLWRE